VILPRLEAWICVIPYTEVCFTVIPPDLLVTNGTKVQKLFSSQFFIIKLVLLVTNCFFGWYKKLTT